jgi:hypothetical protein
LKLKPKVESRPKFQSFLDFPNEPAGQTSTVINQPSAEGVSSGSGPLILGGPPGASLDVRDNAVVGTSQAGELSDQNIEFWTPYLLQQGRASKCYLGI